MAQQGHSIGMERVIKWHVERPAGGQSVINAFSSVFLVGTFKITTWVRFRLSNCFMCVVVVSCQE